MVQCEMCGAETAAPNTVKVEGAELDVCDECADFGTEVRTQESSSASTKYSTDSSGSSSSSSSGSASGGGGSGGSSGGGSRRDMFDEMDELVQDFDQRIRSAREAADMSQEELADQLNEKASLIRKLEHGDHLPSDDVQQKLERALDIELTESGGTDDDADWDSGSAVGEYTLGDVVERKDS
ncbi:transcriptional regulator, XRE family [Halorhabdus utahensis DSM 12940]|uniref:Transcriptional regulator, XRE family n=1 Tax=Halorhabdus utahensis (strain DSM 12940 / JCM 11049 / AX-2) TaxID=519442 RepID=C7NRB0_HALUD|nr:multiprotein bridging factor aMBF1 [Halorhabdus utahensis]ACV10547.1 transcriptional regulator, XRE family [Halorhabdus utahensis DSM 12940]